MHAFFLAVGQVVSSAGNHFFCWHFSIPATFLSFLRSHSLPYNFFEIIHTQITEFKPFLSIEILEKHIKNKAYYS
jgi:hypothetical protein